jgi:predicted metal-dependent hydrolase
MECIQYGNKAIRYEIKRGKRKKTVAIHVDTDSVTVRAPLRLNDGKIRMIMEKKARWIVDRQERLRQDRFHCAGRRYVSGEFSPYLGKLSRLQIKTAATPEAQACKLRAGLLRIEINPALTEKESSAAVRDALIGWYRQKAEKKIAERIPLIAGELGVTPQSVTIKDQKRQWGSCSSSGAIRFNWKIVMAPSAIIDYIIAHELCHLMHADHRAQFWRKVQTVIPDYRLKKDWLKEHSTIINALE